MINEAEWGAHLFHAILCVYMFTKTKRKETTLQLEFEKKNNNLFLEI